MIEFEDHTGALNKSTGRFYGRNILNLVRSKTTRKRLKSEVKYLERNMEPDDLVFNEVAARNDVIAAMMIPGELLNGINEKPHLKEALQQTAQSRAKVQERRNT